ncbi:MAG: hypothetical protein HQL41_12840 [Alphaproteobacteria bacterium]|nr:hypothetical protein [Alphaproteobacteria bacterium]
MDTSEGAIISAIRLSATNLFPGSKKTKKWATGPPLNPAPARDRKNVSIPMIVIPPQFTRLFGGWG